MSAEDLNHLVRELADREAIRELPLRYCDCVWRGDAEGLAGLFAEDSTLDLSSVGENMSGREEIRRELGRAFEAGERRALPFIHNQVFDLEGDRATGRSYLEVHMLQGEQIRTGRGYYDDEFVREGDTWKFRSRRAHFVTAPLD